MARDWIGLSASQALEKVFSDRGMELSDAMRKELDLIMMLDQPLTVRHLVAFLWIVSLVVAILPLGMTLGELAWWWNRGGGDRAIETMLYPEPEPELAELLTDEQIARIATVMAGAGVSTEEVGRSMRRISELNLLARD